MKTFVVNLKRSPERRKYMQELLKDFPYPWKFFEAVDGTEIKKLSEVYNETKAIHFYGKVICSTGKNINAPIATTLRQRALKIFKSVEIKEKKI